jgi:thymidine kinase
MFSDKTTILMTRLTHEFDMAKRDGSDPQVCCLNSDKDTRPDQSENGTANFSTHKSSKTQYPFPIFKCRYLRDFDAGQYLVIGIDEGQFFDDIVETTQKWLSQGKLVITAGLSGTFQQKPFNRYLDLLSMATHHELVRASCDLCPPKNGHIRERNAPFTRRITDSQEVEIVGGANMYIAVCKDHLSVPISPEMFKKMQLKKSR